MEVDDRRLLARSTMKPREALTKRWASDEDGIRGASADPSRIQSEFQRAEAAIPQELELKPTTSRGLWRI